MSEKAQRIIDDFIARKLDRAFMDAFYDAATSPGAAASVSYDPEKDVLTVAKLQVMLDAAPPRETWVVSAMFPPNCATVVKTDRENLTCINDGTWLRLQSELRRQMAAEHRHNPLYEIRPIFIDADALDTPEHADWRADQRKRVLDIIAGTITATVELHRVVRAWWHRL